MKTGKKHFLTSGENAQTIIRDIQQFDKYSLMSFPVFQYNGNFYMHSLPILKELNLQNILLTSI